jgi:anaerobic selenocysteine-containing dehydrogenase
MTPAEIELNPQDADRLGLPDGAVLGLSWDRVTQEIQVRRSPNVPPGLALVPRNCGLKIDEPAPAPFPQAKVAQ